MQKGQETRDSLWLDKCDQQGFPSLDRDVEVDVAVIGGGITGLNTAWKLQEEGLRVAVVEARRISSGVTGYSTAKITSQHGLIYDHLTTAFGKEAARVYAEANQTAVSEFRKMIRSLSIECNLSTRSAFTYTRDANEVSPLEREIRAAEEAGIPARFSDQLDLPFPVEGAVEFPDQAQFHPCRYLAALSKELAKNGVEIFERTRVLSVKDGSSPRAVTDKGVIRAGRIVLANHSPSSYSGLFYTRMVPKRSYVLAAEIQGTPPTGMYYSTGKPFHSIRSFEEDGKNLILLGGQNHKTGHHHSSRTRYEQLEKDARAMFQVESIRYAWSTQDQVSMDHVPYIGKVPVTKNIFLAVGFGGWGISHSMVAAILLTDLIMGRINDWKLLYSPTRMKLTGISLALEQNIHFARHVIKDRFHSAPAVEPSSLHQGEGKVGSLGGKETAMAKDLTGEIHAVSPFCTHMGCAVVYNDGEQSWDCPCHGSRFGIHGTVLHGPAVRNLEERKGAEERKNASKEKKGMGPSSIP